MSLTSIAKPLVVAAVVGLVWASKGVPRCAPSDNPVDVAVEVVYAGGDSRSISISLTNNGERAIELLECDLPWQHWHSIELVLFKSDDAMKVVEAGVLPIDDPVAAVVKIAPGEVVRGEIRLSRIYPTLDDDLASSRVDVFYAFDINPIGDSSPRRFGGWFNIPRNDRSNLEAEKDRKTVSDPSQNQRRHPEPSDAADSP